MLLLHYLNEMYYSSSIIYEFSHGTEPKCSDNRSVRIIEVRIIEVGLYCDVVNNIVATIQLKTTLYLSYILFLHQIVATALRPLSTTASLVYENCLHSVWVHGTPDS